jgi:transposase-like protein
VTAPDQATNPFETILRERGIHTWHLDEMAVLISGRQFWLWRAVDDDGEVLDLLVQRRRDARAAARLMAQTAQEAGLCARSAGDRHALLLCSGQDATAIVGSP